MKGNGKFSGWKFIWFSFGAGLYRIHFSNKISLNCPLRLYLQVRIRKPNFRWLCGGHPAPFYEYSNGRTMSWITYFRSIHVNGRFKKMSKKCTWKSNCYFRTVGFIKSWQQFCYWVIELKIDSIEKDVFLTQTGTYDGLVDVGVDERLFLLFYDTIVRCRSLAYQVPSPFSGGA